MSQARSGCAGRAAGKVAVPIPYVEPEHFSEAVLFLASYAARYITGQQLRVDGAVSSK